MSTTPPVASRAAKVALPHATVSCARQLHTNFRRAIRTGRLRTGGGSITTPECPAGSIWGDRQAVCSELTAFVLVCAYVVVHSGAQRSRNGCTREAYKPR